MAKILYIEDDRDLSSLLMLWLTRRKHTVLLAQTGLDAMELLEFDRFDLILMDWSLPDMKGTDICENYRKQNGKTPIIMLTGSAGPEIIDIATAAGANLVLLKPPDLPALGAAIESLAVVN